MLVVMIGIRKSLDFIFTRRELKILDDVMPELSKRNQQERMEQDAEVGCCAKLSACILGSKPIKDKNSIEKVVTIKT